MEVMIAGTVYNRHETLFIKTVYLQQCLNDISGRFFAEYCPGVSGCRAVIEFDDVPDITSIDLSTFNYVISFSTTTTHPVWLVCQKHSFGNSVEFNKIGSGTCDEMHGRCVLYLCDSMHLQDYVVVIPSDQYTIDVLEIVPVDMASVFISQCGQDNFYIEYV